MDDIASEIAALIKYEQLRDGHLAFLHDLAGGFDAHVEGHAEVPEEGAFAIDVLVGIHYEALDYGLTEESAAEGGPDREFIAVARLRMRLRGFVTAGVPTLSHVDVLGSPDPVRMAEPGRKHRPNLLLELDAMGYAVGRPHRADRWEHREQEGRA